MHRNAKSDFLCRMCKKAFMQIIDDGAETRALLNKEFHFDDLYKSAIS